MSLARLIRSAAAARGLTLSQLAVAAGISRSTLYLGLERGGYSLLVAGRLSVVLGLDADELAYWGAGALPCDELASGELVRALGGDGT